jgi:hypothetical protein
MLNGERLSWHDHAEVFLGVVGNANATASAYPDRRGIQLYERAEQEVWSTGVIELSDAQRTGIVNWCLGHPCVQYGWLDYAALILHRLGMKDPALRRYIAASGHDICSQYASLAYLHGGGMDLFPGEWEGYVTPEMLAGRVGQA